MAKEKAEIVQNEKPLAVLAELEKKFGKGILQKFSDKIEATVSAISTGVIGLDYALGVGGVPQGRLTIIYGEQFTGKTYLCLQVIAHAQSMGLRCAIVDTEHALDMSAAKLLGVDVDSLYLCQPDTANDAMEVIEALVKSKDFGLIVLDSIAAMPTKEEVDGEYGDSVTYDTPVYIRDVNSKAIGIVAIADLYRGQKEFKPNSYQMWYKKLKTTEVLTHMGWKKLLGVVKKKNYRNKPIVVTKTSSGFVKSTDDHCLFVGGQERKASDLSVGDVLDTKLPYDTRSVSTLNPDIAWLLGFWCAEGSVSRPKTNINSLSVSNTDLSVVEECKRVLDKHFLQRSTIKTRTYMDGVRKPLYTLYSTSNKQVGSLLESCLGPVTRLKVVPDVVLNGNDEIKRAFVEGFFIGDGSHNTPDTGRKYFNNSLPLLAGMQFLLESLGKKTSFYSYEARSNQLTLAEVDSHLSNRTSSEITTFYNLDAPELLYDIATEAGTFVTAIGNIVVHNSNVGRKAKLMAQACRRLTPLLNETGCALLATNQLIDNIGAFGYQETTTMPAGKVLKFTAAVLIEVKKIQQVKDGDVVAGHINRLTVKKNKVGIPFKTAEYEVTYGQNWIRQNELVKLGEDLSIFDKAGSWYSYNGERIGQGRPNVKQYLQDNPNIADEIELKIRKKLSGEE